MTTQIDWYENRDQLRPDQIFTTREGDKVKLDSRVEGDGTRWYVAAWFNERWLYDGNTIEPGDLIEQVQS